MSGKRRGRVTAPIIAIDGPSGVGKTTISKRIAKKLNFRYIDTGAMYRAFALGAKDEGVDAGNEKELEEFSRRVDIRFGGNGEKIFLNGRDYTKKIREPLSGELASLVSTKKVVRETLVSLQRKLAGKGCVVVEGRDIGTVVFPHAEVKIFLDASKSMRAQRRHGEIPGLFLENVAVEMEERDRRDRTREHSPLVRAEDAVYMDTTDLGIEEVEQRLLKVIKEKLKLGDIDR